MEDLLVVHDFVVVGGVREVVVKDWVVDVVVVVGRGGGGGGLGG